jgi:hypothetical protein
MAFPESMRRGDSKYYTTMTDALCESSRNHIGLNICSILPCGGVRHIFLRRCFLSSAQVWVSVAFSKGLALESV